MFQFLVALRYLRSERKVRAVFSSAFVAVAGTAVGVFSLNIVLAVMTGFQTELSRAILGASPHIVVSSYFEEVENRALVEEKIKLAPGVKAVSPVIYGTGLLLSDFSSIGARATGVYPDVHAKVSHFPASETGENTKNAKSVFSYLNADSGPRPKMVLGYALASSLGVEEGDTVAFVTSFDKKTPLRKKPLMKRFEVAGIFKYGIAHYDSNVLYINFEDAEEMFQTSPVFFEVALHNPMESESAARKIEDTAGFPFVAQSWQEANSKLFSAIRLEKLALTIFLGFIVVVAALSVMNVLLMITLEKKRDIAIIRAAGASRAQVGSVFLIIGGILGLAGTFIGTAAAFAICYLLANSQTVAGFIPFDPAIYGISKFPVTIEPLYFFTIGAASPLLCIFAALYPAYCAFSGSLAEKLKVQ